MKVTFETTLKDKYSRKVVMETPYDDLTIDAVFEEFIRPLLLAWGYAEKSVDNHLDGHE